MANALVKFWESIEKTGDAIKAARSARSVQRKAEMDVSKAFDELEVAKGKFEKAKIDAKNNVETGFKNIYEAYMSVKVKQQRFDDAVTVYKELFEEEPKLLY